MITISEAEFKVMKVVWDKKRTTSSEIIKEVAENNWNNNTVRTLINRLVQKKAIGISDKNGRIYTFVPLIDEEKYKNYVTMNFIKKLFNGSIKGFILFMAENDKSICNEIKVILKDLIDKVEKNERKN